MARLQTLYLPDDHGFAFILDQVTQPDTIPAANADPWAKLHSGHWHEFAEKCGAKSILITPETIEILDPFGGVVDAEIVDDEPTPLTELDLEGFVRELMDNIKFIGSEEWTNPDEGGCGITLNVHKHDDCPADDDTWCVIHYPMPGPWDGWPRWFDKGRKIMTRVCPHDIKHPTPEEYARGFDGEHDCCDPCLCCPDKILTVITALKGSAPSPEEIGAFLDQHEANRAAEARLLDAIFPDESTLTEREKRIRTLAGVPEGEPIPQATATITPLDAEGNPTGKPVTVPMSGMTITQREYVDPIFGRAESFPSDEQLKAAIADAPISGDWTPGVAQSARRACGAMNSAGAGCVKNHGHEYLHEFAKAAAPLDSGHDTAGA